MTLMPVFRNSVGMVLTSNDYWARFHQVVVKGRSKLFAWVCSCRPTDSWVSHNQGTRRIVHTLGMSSPHVESFFECPPGRT